MSADLLIESQAELTPARIVHLLNQYIIGQEPGKRSVAVAVRNRWRRQQLSEELRQEVNPKNILMIGPTGVGKTEIARRLAKITGAPFIKVEATKFTEVGYYGRDVESMIRELVENAIILVKKELKTQNESTAQERCEERLLDLLCGVKSADSDHSKKSRPEAMTPHPHAFSAKSTDGGLEILATIFGMPNESTKEPAMEKDPAKGSGVTEKNGVGKEEHTEAEDRDSDAPTDGENVRNEEPVNQAKVKAATEKMEPELQDVFREKMRRKLRAGELEQRIVEFRVEQKSSPMIFGPLGGDNMDRDMQSMLEKIMPKSSKTKQATVQDARQILFEQEFEKLLDEDQVNGQAISLAENLGVIFLDEIDKLVASDSRGADVSRQGVQRDLLPLVEGTIVNTRYGQVRTDHILFVAAGAFHKNQPSDLMPELQGRFPIRVELSNLTEDDFVRILSEPTSSLTKQYCELLKTEGVILQFTEDGIRTLARHAFQLNQTTQNIGARRLHTLLEKVLEEVSFSAAEMDGQTVLIDADYVDSRLKELLADQDLSRFIL